MSQAEFKGRLQALMNKPENQICSDCPERQPRWASLIKAPPGSAPGSIPIGAFCCLECSGSHRRLGVHIAFVRSINLDSWKEKEVLGMENGGNKRVNAIFEGKLKNFGAHSGKPTTGADGRTRERFIRDKYERRKYFDPEAAVRTNVQEEEEESSEEESEEEVVVAKKKTPSTKMPSIRAPSDAARQRAESRKARLNAYRAKETANSTPAVPVPIRNQICSPAPPKAQEVDLLGFSSTPPTQQPPIQSVVTDPAAASIDLFAQIHISPSTRGASSQPTATTITFTQQQQQPEPQPEQQPQPQSLPQTQSKKFNNEEILSMFNTPAPTPYYPNVPTAASANAISNIAPNHNGHQYGMQPAAMQSYGYPMMMQQQTAAVQSSNPTQFQYQAYNNSFMTSNNSGYKGSTGAAAHSATSTASTHMFVRQSNASTATPQHQTTQLDRNGFPMF